MLTQVCPTLGGERWLCWAHVEQGEGSVSWRVSSSPHAAAPTQHPPCSTLLLAQRHRLLPLHLLCQTCCCPIPLPLPSLGTGTASGTAGGAPAHPVGGKAEFSRVEGQEKAGVGLDVGHLPHPHSQRSGLEVMLSVHSGMVF